MILYKTIEKFVQSKETYLTKFFNTIANYFLLISNVIKFNSLGEHIIQ
jgi:hypothetical protein